MQELEQIVKAVNIPNNRLRINVQKRIALCRIIKKNNITLSLEKIGELLGKNHSTITHYLARHEQEASYDDYKFIYTQIEQIYLHMAKQNREEEKLQIKFYTYFHNTYPEYRGLLVYNLNNPRNAIDGHSAKLMGLRKSRPDMELYWKGSVHLLELKIPSTNPNQDQLDYHEMLRGEGLNVTVARTFDECVEWLEGVIKKGAV